MGNRFFKHLTYTDRLNIEKWLKEKVKKAEIARRLRIHPNTVTNEIKRGRYQRFNRNADRLIWAYSASIAEEKYREGKHAGRELKIGSDIALANQLESLMSGKQADGRYLKAKRFSPAAAIQKAKELGFEVPFCLNTLYNYVKKGIFLSLTQSDLIGRGRKKRTCKRIHAKRPPAGESIEYRPEDIFLNHEYGHWEMDSVIGKQKSKQCLITLTERKSLEELAYLVPDHTAGSVVNVLDTLERKLGSDTFRRLFRSITVDNGTEFSSCEELEKSCISSLRRTKLYYCHPYSSWERGKNENQNRMLRRFFPKGTDFDQVTQEDVDEAVNWINSYPRASLGWKCSSDLFRIPAIG